MPPSTQTPVVSETNGSTPAARRSVAKHPLGIELVVWIPPKDDLEHHEWMLIGRHLGTISRCSQWWLGDWVSYGTARWGEKYSDAARATGYDSRSLANMVSVAHAFPPSRRRDNLTWSHHAALAGLTPSEQDKWLDRAGAERLSVADLRTELRSQRRLAVPSSNAHEGRQVFVVVCPQCKESIRVDKRTRSAVGG
jgi:hypothetical protein